MAKSKLLAAVVDANVPQLAAAAAAYYTFSDKPYAVPMALDQVTATLLDRSMAGVIWEFVLEYI